LKKVDESGTAFAVIAATTALRAMLHAERTQNSEDAMNQNLAIIACLTAAAYGAANLGTTAAVEGGAASFVVNTTVPGISVKGKSTALEAHAVVQRVPDGLHLEKMEASIPVKSILTGMAVRDEHMRRYIFTTADGKTPDLRFEAAVAACSAQAGRTNEFLCQVSGTLNIRGTAGRFSIPLKIRAEGAVYRATGDSTVKLSEYGIEQPSQFGVKTSDEIQLHIEFSGKEGPAEIASGGRQ
jgi:polyisoprenoid-binding protein YceI